MYSREVEAVFKKEKISLGDIIKVSSGKGTFEGKLMPRPEVGDSSVIRIKLGNGYDIGIRFDDKSKISKISSSVMPKQEVTLHKFNPRLPKVSLIYTGGTIGSKIDYVSGGVYMLTKPEELLSEVPELADIADIKTSNLMSISSEDMTYVEWQKIAKEAAASLNAGARGVVITHGTDTMHYTSAALSFMLQNLNAPVVLTGSQRSTDRGSSDGFMNLLCSTRVAADSDVAEVGICMHETMNDTSCSLIRGTKARKMHTSRRDAFKPVNDVPLLRVGPSAGIKYIGDHKKRDSTNHEKVSVLDKFEPKVALLKTYPNATPEILEFYSRKGYKGIIIEGTGLGHAPVSTEHKGYNWLKGIADAVDSGMVVGMTSQCLYGRVNTDVYRNLRLISRAGAVYCEDMLPEVATVKLGFLLGNYKAEKAREMLSQNIAGEITERSEIFEESV